MESAPILARILIADDHEMIRTGIRSLLESRNDVEVSEACDGREAVEKTLDLCPDLVILDVSMPLLDGFSAAREIRRLSPSTAILILTFHKTDALTELAREIGASGFLTKTDNGDALLTAIDGAIADLNQATKRGHRPIFSGEKQREQRPGNSLPSQELRKPLLQVLFLHSQSTCVERCLQELKGAQFQVRSHVVVNSQDCTEQLNSNHYDVILAEYPIPKMQRGPTLGLLSRTNKHTPLIFVTDRMDREAVAELITKGAADCVELDNFGHLSIAVRRALEKSDSHRARHESAKRQKSEAHYRALINNLAFGICLCGMEGQFLDVNQTLITMLGYPSQGELLGVNLAADILCDPSKRAQLLGVVSDSGRVDPLEIDWKRQDGTSLKVRLSGREVNIGEGNAVGYGIIVEDVTKQRELEERLRQEAVRDPLTGLANYRYLVGVLDGEIERSKRTGREFALLLLDLDRLKQINDRYGHLTGSEALCRLASVLSSGCRQMDTAARFGGDEFAIVLPETGASSAKLVARRLCDNLANDGRNPQLSVSVGVAIYPTDGELVETLLLAADTALYEMKASVHVGPR